MASRLLAGDLVGGEMTVNPSERLEQATQVLKINLPSRSSSLGLKGTKLKTNSTSIIETLL